MAKESIIIAEDYDGVFVNTVNAAFKNMLRKDNPGAFLLRSISFDGVKELGYQLLKNKIFLPFVLDRLPTEIAPRVETLEIFRMAQGFDIGLVLLTSNSRLDTDALEQESERYNLKVHAVYVKNLMEKGRILDSMSEGKKLLFEDDPVIALKAASYKNVEVGIVRESYNRMGSKLISTNQRIHRLDNWGEAISLARNFMRSNLNESQNQKLKSVA